MDSNKLKITIPLEITISAGQTEQIQVAKEAAPSGSSVSETIGVEEAAHPRSYYDGCSGYDANFLSVPVPLVTLSDEQRRNAAKDNLTPAGQDPTVLRYTNFSVVLNRRRQLAYYTAVNIDGAQSQDIHRENDKWFYDSRIAESEQIGEELYKRNKLDRGHLVRRLDPVWGPQASLANDQTFHFTNCSPQHEKFNQGQQLWQGLENYILDRADALNRKVTVFTGPIMSDSDPIYRGVRLPLAYWKILAYIKNQRLAVAAYVLDQAGLIAADLGFEAAFEVGAFRVTLANLQERTNLNFAYLQEFELPNTLDGFEADLDRIKLEEDFENVIL